MNRRVISITGEDRIKFLQGQITHDARLLTQGKPLYTAILTPQGKLLVDFFLVPEGDAILLDITESEADALLKRLTMFKLRSDVTLLMTDRTVSRGIGAASEGAISDPRHADLGWRAYDGRPDEEVDWDALRVALVVPEFGIELSGDSYILEQGFERLNGVDFKKGCYVGQEVTARMKHKTELRKGLVQVDITGAASLGAMLKSEDGKEAGTLYTQSGSKALAHLRFDRANGPMSVDGSDAVVTWSNSFGN